MTWMNHSEVDEAVDRFRPYPNRHRAACFLKAFVEEVDARSDGWPYWSAPSRAAKQLMELLAPAKARWNTNDITLAQLNKALKPIKSFYTRRGYAAGMQYPTI